MSKNVHNLIKDTLLLKRAYDHLSFQWVMYFAGEDSCLDVEERWLNRVVVDWIIVAIFKNMTVMKFASSIAYKKLSICGVQSSKGQ